MASAKRVYFMLSLLQCQAPLQSSSQNEVTQRSKLFLSWALLSQGLPLQGKESWGVHALTAERTVRR